MVQSFKVLEFEVARRIGTRLLRHAMIGCFVGRLSPRARAHRGAVKHAQIGARSEVAD